MAHLDSEDIKIIEKLIYSVIHTVIPTIVREIVTDELGPIRDELGPIKQGFKGLKQDIEDVKKDMQDVKKEQRSLGIKFEDNESKLDVVLEQLSTNLQVKGRVDGHETRLKYLEKNDALTQPALKYQARQIKSLQKLYIATDSATASS